MIKNRGRNIAQLYFADLPTCGQMNELNKRMFAIENLLSRLEEKMGPADEVSRPTISTQANLTSQLLFLVLAQVRAQKVFLFLCLNVVPVEPK